MKYATHILTASAILSGAICLAAPPKTESRSDQSFHDFHYDARYPGYRRSDVSLDKVTQKGNGDLKTYHERRVEWWPKRGVDVVPLADIPHAPLRTWTVKKHLPHNFYVENLPRGEFRAHLLGFRGVGDPYPMDPKDPDSFHCPAVVLRLADGRKRIFLGEYFTPKDRQYIIKTYMKDRKRVDSTLLKGEYTVPPHAMEYPEGESHLYKPGKVRFDTTHFSVLTGSQSPTDRPASHWINVKKQAETRAMRNHYLSQLESFWAYMEYAGCHMRFWKDEPMYKYTIGIGGTLHDGHKVVGSERGGGGGGYTRCTTGGPWIEIVYHEWGHGMETANILSLGGGETGADGCAIMAEPHVVAKADHQMLKPWKNFFHGAYPGTGGYEMLADDPNWGYAVVPILLGLASEEDLTPMHVIAHLGEERGIWPKGQGIRGMGDLMGQIGARFAEYDVQQEYQFRGWNGTANFSYLEAVDPDKGLYRCPSYEAPEPFGVHASRLVAKKGAKGISVDFKGQFDPETYSDWRACIVAVGKDGTCRYSPLWNKGKMTMKVRPGDRRYWLTVTATPTALLESAGTLYQGAFAFRYPFDVVLKNCRPARSLGIVATKGRAFLLGLYDRQRAHDPALFTSEAARETFMNSLKPGAAMAEATLEKEGLLKKEKPAARDQRRMGTLRSRMERPRALLGDRGGSRHPNGGGWISSTSFAAPTAYVGPACMVLEGAKVLDQASLVNGAVAIGKGAVVRDHARLSGKGAAIGLVEVSGYARVIRPIANHITAQMDPLSVKTTVAPVVPMRIKDLSADGLFANYDCRRPETVLFEDCLKERTTGPFYLGHHTDAKEIFFDGILVNKPGFEAFGRADGALLFDGETQYAEADPAVADLGEITVILRVRPATTKGQQVLFDFGSGPGDYFRLALHGAKPVLEWSAGGKSDSLTSSVALQAGQWAVCRVEISGTAASLFVGDKQVASKATTFRPAQAYVPGQGRRNYIFRSRDEAPPAYTAGALDYLRIYYLALGGKPAPATPLISPVKPMAEILKMEDEEFGDRSARVQVYQDLLRSSSLAKTMRDYNDRFEARAAENAMGPTDETRAAAIALRAKIKQIEIDIETKTKSVQREYSAKKKPAAKQAPIARNVQERIAELEKKRHALRPAMKAESAAADAAHEVELARIETTEEYAAYQAAKVEQERQKALERKSKTEADAIRDEVRKSVLEANPDLEAKAIDARTSDQLLKNKPYIETAVRAAYAQQKAREKLPELPMPERKPTPAKAEFDALGREINQLRGRSRNSRPEAGFEAVKRKALAPLTDELGQLKGDLKTMLVRNSLAARPDEYRMREVTRYKRQQMVGRNSQLWSNAAQIMAGPDAPDDRKQLRAALRDQGTWHTECDWDTMNKWEKDFDNLNPRLQRWLRRAKPYRYAEK